MSAITADGKVGEWESGMLAPALRKNKGPWAFAAMADKINYWKLVIWKASSGSLHSVLTGLPTVLLTWDSMNHTLRVIAVCGLAGGVIKFLDGFFDTTYSRLAQGKPPVELPGLNGNAGQNHTEAPAPKP